jgi:photosystem II stability/assembly factor-like uncharacterized protein
MRKLFVLTFSIFAFTATLVADQSPSAKQVWRSVGLGKDYVLTVESPPPDSFENEKKMREELEKRAAHPNIRQKAVVRPTWRSVFFGNRSVGWTVGQVSVGVGLKTSESRALVSKTQDGGETWETHAVLSEGDLSDVFFTNESHGWAVGCFLKNDGATGVIIETKNGGATWRKRFEVEKGFDGDGASVIKSVFFIDEKRGWVTGYADGRLGGFIAATDDGGAIWKLQLQGDADFHMEKIRFHNEKFGFAVGSEGVLRTIDGGETWRRCSEKSFLFDIRIVSRDEAWVVGANGLLLHTGDGGETWSETKLPKPYESMWLSSVVFQNGRRGWVAGDKGVILTTGDGGKTWMLESEGASPYLHGLCEADGSVFAVGVDGVVLKRN